MLEVIIPTRNAAADIEPCLLSLEKQVDPVRILVVDAHSSDETRDIAHAWGCTIIDEPPSTVKGSRRAVACNEGLRHITGDKVAFLDADVEVPPEWSRDIVKPLGGNVAGATTGCVPSDTSQGWIMRLGSPNHAHQFKEVTPLTSLPGYNSAYLVKAIREVGGFCEELGGCEDYELNMRIRAAGWKLIGVPSSPVVHRERDTLEAFSRQMRGYGWSRGRLLRVKRHFTPQHAVPTLLLPLSMLLPRKYAVATFLREWGIGYAEGLLTEDSAP